MLTRWARAAPLIAVALFYAADAGIAQVWCGNCHLVDPREQQAAREGVPTFLSITRMKSTTEPSLSAVLKSRHGAMPDLTLSREEIEDVSAFILSLRELP